MKSTTVYRFKELPWYGYFLLLMAAFVFLSVLFAPLNVEFYRMQHEVFMSVPLLGIALYILYVVQIVTQGYVVYEVFKPTTRGFIVLLINWATGLLTVGLTFWLTIIRSDMYGKVIADFFLQQVELTDPQAGEVMAEVAPLAIVGMQAGLVFSGVVMLVVLYVYVRNRGFFVDAAAYKKKRDKTISPHAEGTYTFKGL